MDHVIWYPNERVDISDLRAATGGLILAELERLQRTLMLPSGRSTTGQAATAARIVGGFTRTVAANVFTLAAGQGILARNDGGVLRFGAVLGDQSPASYALTLGSDGLHAIWIRAVSTPSDAQNRAFWDASGGAETIDSVPTRSVATWEAVSRLASAGPPGVGEYVKVWEATVAGGVITGSTDFRHFFFEGSAHPTDAYEQEWGSGNDRNADRAAYGVQDLHRFVQMVRRQLSDAIDPVGGQAAHKAITVGLHQLDDEHKTNGKHGAVNADSLTVTGLTSVGNTIVAPGVGTNGLVISPGALAMTGTAVPEDYRARRDPASSTVHRYAVRDCFGFEERGRADITSDFRSSYNGAFATSLELSQHTPPWGVVASAGPTKQAIGSVGINATPGLGIYVPADTDAITITPGAYDTAGMIADLPALELMFSTVAGGLAAMRVGMGLTVAGTKGIWMEALNYGAGAGFNLKIDFGAGPGGVGLLAPIPAVAATYSFRLVLASRFIYWADVRMLDHAPGSSPVSLGSMTFDATLDPLAPLDADTLGVSITVENQSGGAGLGSLAYLHRFQYRSRGMLMLP